MGLSDLIATLFLLLLLAGGGIIAHEIIQDRRRAKIIGRLRKGDKVYFIHRGDIIRGNVLRNDPHSRTMEVSILGKYSEVINYDAIIIEF